MKSLHAHTHRLCTRHTVHVGDSWVCVCVCVCVRLWDIPMGLWLFGSSPSRLKEGGQVFYREVLSPTFLYPGSNLHLQRADHRRSTSGQHTHTHIHKHTPRKGLYVCMKLVNHINLKQSESAPKWKKSDKSLWNGGNGFWETTNP